MRARDTEGKLFPGKTKVCAIQSFLMLVRVKDKKQVSEGGEKLIN